MNATSCPGFSAWNCVRVKKYFVPFNRRESCIVEANTGTECLENVIFDMQSPAVIRTTIGQGPSWLRSRHVVNQNSFTKKRLGTHKLTYAYRQIVSHSIRTMSCTKSWAKINYLAKPG